MRAISILSCIVGLVILAWNLSSLRAHRDETLPRGFYLAGMALELPVSANEVSEISSHAKHTVRNSLWADSFILVPVYVFLLVSHGVGLRNGGWQTLGSLVILLTVVAGIADEFENMRQRTLIDALSPTNDQVRAVFTMAACKWASLAAVLSLLGAAAWPRGGWWRVATAICDASAFLMLAGLAAYRPLVQYGFSMMGLGLLVLGLLSYR
jgi:hypothetical protein